MKYQLVILFAVACLATSQKTTRSLEEMIEDEYTPKPTTPSQTTTTTLQPRFFFGSYPYERNCTCVPYSLCSPYTKNGTAYDASSNGDCEDILSVCCEESQMISHLNEPTEQITTQKPITILNLSTTPKAITTLNLSTTQKAITTLNLSTTQKPIETKTCGKRQRDGIDSYKVVSAKDNQAEFGEFPWMVAIMKNETVDQQQYNLTYKCGGSLIHPQAVLTAAHCVRRHPANTLIIQAGDWDLQSDEENSPRQDREVQTVIVHEGFISAFGRNDYAILILAKPVQLANNVDVICLPEQDMLFDHSRCIATGWGKDKDGEKGRYQAILKKVELPIINSETCQNSLRQTRFGPRFHLHETLICAGGESEEDTCHGDGGSPLVCPIQNEPDRYYQAGIVSWGLGCGTSAPGLYANVAKARQWIDGQINAHFINFINDVQID